MPQNLIFDLNLKPISEKLTLRRLNHLTLENMIVGAGKLDPHLQLWRTTNLRRICGSEGTTEAKQRDGAVMALNGDGRGAREEKKKKKRKKKNKRETMRIGNREKGKKRETQK
jgi:hypothetical protein